MVVEVASGSFFETFHITHKHTHRLEQSSLDEDFIISSSWSTFNIARRSIGLPFASPNGDYRGRWGHTADPMSDRKIRRVPISKWGLLRNARLEPDETAMILRSTRIRQSSSRRLLSDRSRRNWPTINGPAIFNVNQWDKLGLGSCVVVVSRNLVEWWDKMTLLVKETRYN